MQWCFQDCAWMWKGINQHGVEKHQGIHFPPHFIRAYMSVSWNSWLLDTPSFIFLSSKTLGSARFLTLLGMSWLPHRRLSPGSLALAAIIPVVLAGWAKMGQTMSHHPTPLSCKSLGSRQTRLEVKLVGFLACIVCGWQLESKGHRLCSMVIYSSTSADSLNRCWNSIFPCFSWGKMFESRKERSCTCLVWWGWLRIWCMILTRSSQDAQLYWNLGGKPQFVWALINTHFPWKASHQWLFSLSLALYRATPVLCTISLLFS